MSLRERMLLHRLRERDEKAFRELVAEHRDRVFNVTYRMLGNRAEAEDVAQEVFISVFKTIDTFREEAKFSTWLYRVAVNHCKNRIKYLARRHQRDHDELEEDQRVLVVLRDIEDLSMEEICEITGLPDGTVKSRLHRARLALRKKIQKHL